MDKPRKVPLGDVSSETVDRLVSKLKSGGTLSAEESELAATILEVMERLGRVLEDEDATDEEVRQVFEAYGLAPPPLGRG